MATKTLLHLILLFLVFTEVYSDVTITFENLCQQTLWLASSPADGDLDPELEPGALELFYMDDPWTGSIWARTKCSTNSTGSFTCETGDCGSGEINCQGPPPTYPVTLINFGINNNVVSYEVSLIHGHNIGVRIQPDGGSLVEGGSGACPVVDCVQDISNICPSFLVAYNKDGAYVGCNSACDGLKDPKYCCTQSCQPNQYSQLFKQLCSLAHTYPGDSPPLYKCSGANSYNVTFCPH